MDNIDMILSRMDRMEKHLDEMRGAVVQMTRTEERVAQVLEQTTILFSKYDRMENRLKIIEMSDARQVQTVGFITRSGWMVAAAASSFLTALGLWFIK